MRAPPAAATRVHRPSNAPRPTASSPSAMPSPNRNAWCTANDTTGWIGLPATPSSWRWMPTADVASKNDRSASFWMPAYTKVNPRKARRGRTIHPGWWRRLLHTARVSGAGRVRAVVMERTYEKAGKPRCCPRQSLGQVPMRADPSGGVGDRRGRAVISTGCRPPGGCHLHPHAPPTARAEVRRVEVASTGHAVARARGRPAPGAEPGRRGSRRGVHGRPQITFDRAPIGMRRSSSICRSSSGVRPSVVR